MIMSIPLTPTKIVVGALDIRPRRSNTQERIEQIERSRGKRGIGWHYVVMADGTILEGRPVTLPGNHTSGHNHDSIGVGLAGGIGPRGTRGDFYTPELKEALAKLLKNLTSMFQLPVVPQSALVRTNAPYFAIGAKQECIAEVVDG